jgi:hypothetical protein
MSRRRQPSALGDALLHQLTVLRLAIVVLSVLLVLGVAELGLRRTNQMLTALGLPRIPALDARRLPLVYQRPLLDQIASGESYIVFDADRGWVPTPGFNRARDDTWYRHNRDGLRADRDYISTPVAGIRRIAAYGDSFTYCEDVNIDDCWTQQLERQLPASEVMNFGVPGYAPDQAWLHYQRTGAAWHPCAVLIGQMLENIDRVVTRFRPFYYPDTGVWLAKPRYVLEDGHPVLLPSGVEATDKLNDPSWVETNLGPRDAWYFPGMFVANPLDTLELVRSIRTAAYNRHRHEAKQAYQPGTEGFEVMVAVLVGFARQVRADGAMPIVLVFPMEEAMPQYDGRPDSHAALLEALQQQGVPALDLTDALGEAANSIPLRDLFGPAHYSPLGNAIVARTLAEQLPSLIAEACGSG